MNAFSNEQELRKSEIPAVVLNTINSDYGDYEIRDAKLKEDNIAAFYDFYMNVILYLSKKFVFCYVIFKLMFDDFLLPKYYILHFTLKTNKKHG